MRDESDHRETYVDSGDDDVDLAVTEVILPSGRRLTDELVDELVAEARRGVGRPPLDGASESSPRIAFRVPARVKVELEAIALAEGKSFSEVSREAMEDYLDRHRSA
jgi:hypothetical protein